MLFNTETDHKIDSKNISTKKLLDNLMESNATHDDTQDIKYYETGYLPSFNLINDLETHIITAIEQQNYETAVFLSELFYTECMGLDITNISRIQSIYLYGCALFMNQNYETAAEIAEKYKSIHIAIAYIYGRCCLKLSRNEETACLYLVIHLDDYIKNELKDNDLFIFMPNLATVHSLIGKLYQRSDNTKSSINHHLEALKCDPYLWESLTALCDMKVVIDLKNLYTKNYNDSQKKMGVNALRTDLTKQLNNVSGHQIIDKKTTDKKINTDGKSLHYNFLSPFRTANKGRNLATQSMTESAAQGISNLVSYSNGMKNNFSSHQSSISLNQQSSNPLFSNSHSTKSTRDTAYPNVGSPSANQSSIGSLAVIHNNNTHNNNSVPTIIKNKILTTPPSKLANDQRTSFKTPRNINNSSSYMSNTNKKILINQNLNIMDNKNAKLLNESNSINASEETMRLMYIFAKILKTSSRYNSYNAIRIMNAQLPAHILNNMPWCQAQLGKLHFEIVNYDMSLSYFSNLRRIQPTRLADLEIFSTLLWHLDDKVNLSNLSSELLESYPNSSQTWCVLGNYFSLQKDHDEAIRAFEKATELNSRFAYAYTLQGHEYSNNESFDIAKSFYRKALACDPQHYNAYYGLGSCASQLGKFEEALLYFEKARMINPVNVVLICCCGTELEKLYHNEMALKYYELACKLDPKSALAKYRRAELLFTMNRYSVALGQFEELIKLDTENPNLHFMLGKIFQTLGRKKDAIKEYTIALHLDPKGNQFIIDALENCHMQD